MDDSEIDIRAIFGLLRRQFRLIVITIVLIVGVAGLATFALTPIFSATALILVDPSRKNLLDPEAQIGSTSSDSPRVESEVELVRSDSVLMKVIGTMNLVTDEEFGVSMGLAARLLSMLRLTDATPPSGEAALAQVLNNLRSAVSVQRRGLTYLIAVQARSENPAQAAVVANAIVKAYIEDQVSSKISNTLRRVTSCRRASNRLARLSSPPKAPSTVSFRTISIGSSRSPAIARSPICAAR